jgi:hypothetical protein
MKKKSVIRTAKAEFLLTYGWAILVVMFIVGMLSYFGAFDKVIDKMTPPKQEEPTPQMTPKELAISLVGFPDIQITLTKNLDNSTYQVQDDSKTICTRIDENKSLCEPKMLTYTDQLWLAETTINNISFVGLRVMNDQDGYNDVFRAPFDTYGLFRVAYLGRFDVEQYWEGMDFVILGGTELNPDEVYK